MRDCQRGARASHQTNDSNGKVLNVSSDRLERGSTAEVRAQ